MTKHILLFGASGDTGRLITDQALQRGCKVRAIEPDFPSDFADRPGLTKRDWDLIEGGFDNEMEGVDCVISAVGLGRGPQTLLNPPPLYSEGAVNIVKAMRKTGVKRFVTISAAFADPSASVPLWFKAATAPLERIFSQMGEMERVLRVCDDIEWTAVRPGWLLDRPLTEEYEVSLDDLPQGTLRTRRADLAHFMLECALGDRYIHKMPFVARKEGIQLETPPALIEELLPF